MAKKKRSRSTKQKRRQAARRAAISQASQTTQASKSVAESFKEEYRYVLSDLRRMGILAAAMFVLMVVLAFVVG